jgi:hypothetical protein
MDDILTQYIDHTFSPELGNEIYRSFLLFNSFDLNDIYSEFIDLLTYTDNFTSNEIQDKFYTIVLTKVNTIIKAHNIELTEEASLTDRNEILIALYALIDLEDYVPIVMVLESLETPEDKLSLILSDYCALDQLTILSLIHGFNPNVLKLLKEYCYSKEKETLDTGEKVRNSILGRLKIFFDLYGTNNLGYVLACNDIVLGEPFSSYLPYLEEIIVNHDNDELAINILSIIYLTDKGITSPLELFTEVSFSLLGDINKISRIEGLIMKMINKVNEVSEAKKLAVGNTVITTSGASSEKT